MFTCLGTIAERLILSIKMHPWLDVFNSPWMLRLHTLFNNVLGVRLRMPTSESSRIYIGIFCLLCESLTLTITSLPLNSISPQLVQYCCERPTFRINPLIVFESVTFLIFLYYPLLWVSGCKILGNILLFQILLELIHFCVIHSKTDS